MRTSRIILVVALTLATVSGALGGTRYESPLQPTDVYRLYVDTLTEAFPGQRDLLIPISIETSSPTVGINVTLTFDASLLQPILVAPNFFFQQFDVDLSTPGTVKINSLTDLPPPPQVPPITGDTVFAWMLCQVTAQDPGYDVMTYLTFYENPYTPYPDNSLYLEDGGWITPPNLILSSGDLLIFSPLYGDINLNDYAYEIGDAVTFMNFFMGLTEFNARQYANSDCNRDHIQATIADLVYMLCVINGDTDRVAPPPYLPETDGIANNEEFLSGNMKMVDNLSSCEIIVNGSTPLGGAYFEFDYDPLAVEPAAVILDSGADPMEISCVASDGKLKVAVYNWNPLQSNFTGGKLFTVVYRDYNNYGDGMSVTKADFSDSEGIVSDFEYTVNCSRAVNLEVPQRSEVSLSTYPNPFNNAVSIKYNITSGGNYELSVFDILGRRVKTLIDGYVPAGEDVVIWNGTDNSEKAIASGIYFVNLRGADVVSNTKVYLMK